MVMLKLAHELSLPVDAVTQKQAFLGMSGSGKTYGAGVFVEGLLVMGAQVVVLDVVGNWYGLRIAAKGSGDGFKIPVFGGDHGDIPHVRVIEKELPRMNLEIERLNRQLT